MADNNNPKVQIITHAPPPPDLPVYQRADPRAVNFFGKTNYVAALEEKRFIFGIKRSDRRRHMYAIGKSGVGKSKLFELLIRQDIAYGYGLCFLDSHGDLIKELLDFIPQERIKDVILIDPTDSKFPVTFNPLKDVHPEMRHQLTQGLVEILQKQFGANWTARIEHLFRFTVLALLDSPEANMKGIISMLVDIDYRKKVTENISDEMVRRFWEIEFGSWLERYDSEAISPLVNKLSQYLSDPLLKNIFNQTENKIEFEKIMSEQKVLLVNLAKSRIGEESASFLGSIIIAKLKQAGMARANIPEIERRDFYLYADEFQTLMTTTFESLFSEARKYGISLAVSHQFLSQLSQSVQATVLGNCGTIIVFRVSGEDGKKLEGEMTPVFKAKDMINLGVQEFYIKMTIDGNTFDPFSAETLKVMPLPKKSLKEEIIKNSRESYSRAL